MFRKIIILCFYHERESNADERRMVCLFNGWSDFEGIGNLECKMGRAALRKGMCLPNRNGNHLLALLVGLSVFYMIPFYMHNMEGIWAFVLKRELI